MWITKAVTIFMTQPTKGCHERAKIGAIHSQPNMDYVSKQYITKGHQRAEIGTIHSQPNMAYVMTQPKMAVTKEPILAQYILNQIWLT